MTRVILSQAKLVNYRLAPLPLQITLHCHYVWYVSDSQSLLILIKQHAEHLLQIHKLYTRFWYRGMIRSIFCLFYDLSISFFGPQCSIGVLKPLHQIANIDLLIDLYKELFLYLFSGIHTGCMVVCGNQNWSEEEYF